MRDGQHAKHTDSEEWGGGGGDELQYLNMIFILVLYISSCMFLLYPYPGYIIHRTSGVQCLTQVYV